MPVSEHEIAVALERDEFIPYFQPLVEIRTGRIEGFEVLARWNHPERGLIGPDNFIPLLTEKRGLINALLVCLLRKAFVAARGVPSHIGFSVNVAPSQFHDLALPSLLSSMANEAAFDLRRLTVELTESALLGDLKLAGEVAAGIKALGIKLALDDFGTGYSSLLHLQALPFDEIKVDGSFVRTMVKMRQSRKITSAVLGLGQSLGMRTIAEGVEESSQAELLIWQGCDLAQGWFYERPVPAEGIRDLLARRLPVIDPIHAASTDSSEGADAFDASTDKHSQLRAIYDVAPVGLIFLDRDLRYVSLNHRAAELNGAPIKAHLGRKVEDVTPTLYAQTQRQLVRAMQGESFQDLDVQVKASGTNQAERSVQVSLQPARDEAGEIIGVSLSVTDVSATKQKDETLLAYETEAQRTAGKLRASEAQLRATAESLPVGIVLADAPSGRVVFANQKALAIFGKTLRPGVQWSDIVGKATNEAGELVDPESLPMLRAVRNGETTEAIPVRYSRSRTAGVWLSISGAPVRDDNGALIGGIATIAVAGKPARGRIKLLSRAQKFASSLRPASAESASVLSGNRLAEIARKPVKSAPRFARRGVA